MTTMPGPGRTDLAAKSPNHVGSHLRSALHALIVLCGLLYCPQLGHAQSVLVHPHQANLTDLAASGGTINLAPGTYTMHESWLLERDVTIIGAGTEETIVLFEPTDADSHSAITWRGAGRLVLIGLRVEYVGDGPADVLSAESGVIELHHVVITGGWDGDADTEVGSGLVVAGDARARVHRSVVRRNDRHGVAVRDDASLTLVTSQVADNSWSGIAISGDGYASVQDAMAIRNGDHGVAVWGDAYAEIEASVTRDNNWSGVAVFEDAVARLTRVVSAGNGDHGIAVWDDAYATIEAAYAYENDWSGMAMYDEASGRIAGSTSSANLEHGILVFGNAKVLTSFNYLVGNDGTGLMLAQGAWANSIWNRIEHNVGPGIQCLGSAYGFFVNNRVDHNGEDSLTWEGGTRCADPQ